MRELKKCAVIGGIAAVVALTGCSSGQDRAAPSPHTVAHHAAASTAGATPSERAERVPGETVTEAPVLPGGEVVAQAVNVSGNREVALRGGIPAGTLSILVNCQGRGTLTVSGEPVGMSFPLECVEGEVSGTLNQLSQKRARDHGTVHVAAPSGVRWALTVGR